jgi:xanthine dehydrogenase accessory factor
MTRSCFADMLVLIKGAGDLASGVAARLHRSGFPVVMTELAQPLMVRRSVCFGEAVYEGEYAVEGIVARSVKSAGDMAPVLAAGQIPVVVDAGGTLCDELKPPVLVDAIMAKRNLGTSMTDAACVIALGPGFQAGVDCHAVVETNRGHWLGRVIWQGAAEPDTGMPGDVGGLRGKRVLRAPVSGSFEGQAKIGEQVVAGQVLATVDGAEVRAGCDGVLRGLIHSGLQVSAGLKVGDVDPRAEPAHCFYISDKSLAVGGGVLEAILTRLCQPATGG